jgi:hypothetical protein
MKCCFEYFLWSTGDQLVQKLGGHFSVYFGFQELLLEVKGKYQFFERLFLEIPVLIKNFQLSKT